MPTLRAPYQRAAANVFSTSASTTARWKLAQRSASSWSPGDHPSPCARTCRSTAVFSPLKLKSHCPFFRGSLRSGCVIRATGKRRARSLPVLARRSITGPPGYPRPSSFATLSYASPAASSRVRPMARYSPGARTSYRLVWPPDTTSTIAGSGSGPCWRNSDSMWPARWCTGTSGRFHDAASDFANDTPTSSDPTSPGPCVTATAPRSFAVTAAPPARARPRRRCRGCAGATPVRARRRPTRDGSRPATPRRSTARPTAARRRPTSSTTAAAVSSHDVSMPRMCIDPPSPLPSAPQDVSVPRPRDSATRRTAPCTPRAR